MGFRTRGLEFIKKCLGSYKVCSLDRAKGFGAWCLGFRV
jgi:hypothetical protein